VAALSRRYGFQASIDGSSSPFGGTRAALFIPEALLAAEVQPDQDTAPEPPPAEAAEVTGAGLPRRKRHSATTDTQPLPPVLSTTQPRASVAAAWQSGVHGAADRAATSADRAATPSDPAEGTR
jgi:hypothetical protein